MKIFIDTWGWITLTNKRENKHSDVQEFYKSFRKQNGIVYTTNDVLNETFTLIFRRLPIAAAFSAIDFIEDAVKTNYLIIDWVNQQRFEKAKLLRRKYSDKPRISFTDLTSMVIMQELNITQILTDDNHFIQVGLGFNKVPEI